MQYSSQNGFSLIELILVVVIIGVLATIAIKSMQPGIDRARFEATTQEMELLAKAIVGDENLVEGSVRVDYGYVGDVGALPPNLDALKSNPGGYSTWNGPYIKGDFEGNSDDFKKDAWGNSYTYSGGVAITSSGGGSTITRQFADGGAKLTSNSVRGNLYDGLGNPPGSNASNVSVTIYYPNANGGTTSLSSNPTGSGQFVFDSCIPIGNRLIQVVNSSTDDTVSVYVGVNPGMESYCELRFVQGFWSGVSGSGVVAASLVYVPGSAAVSGSGKEHLSFQVNNNTAEPVTINSIVAVYSTSPVSYFEEVKLDGDRLWKDKNNRAGSGETVSFSDETVAAYATVAWQLKQFKDARNGGHKVSVANTMFTITFSNGDEISFTTPTS